MTSTNDKSQAPSIDQWVAKRRSDHTRFLLEHRMVDVDRTISPKDEMFSGDVASYLAVTMSALHGVDAVLLAAGRPRSEIHRILDLPCGHGRVLRGLRALFPEAELVACDLIEDGVDFCAATFDAVPVYSKPDATDVQLPGSFDLIWVGSLLTHLDAPDWPPFLRLFESALAPGGILVFTVAGSLVANLVRAGTHALSDAEATKLIDGWDCDGFGFGNYGHGARAYGCAVASPGWVVTQLAAHPDLRLVTYNERSWDCRQDIVGLMKEPTPY